MIKFALACEAGHQFEAWFQSGEAYERQADASQVRCPVCGSHDVDKAIMAPAVATRSRAAELPAIPADELRQHLRRIREEVTSKAEYVGGKFAEEARRIHFDESPPRGIYGEASADEIKDLAEDGVPFLPLPDLPDEMN